MVWGSERIVFQRTCILLLCGLVVTAVRADAERDSAVATEAIRVSEVQSTEDLPEELAGIRRQLAATYAELSNENAILSHLQREYERTDPAARELREKLKAVEKDLVRLRQSLDSRLEAMGEIRDIESRRKELLAHVKDLKEQERKLLAGPAGRLTVESSRAVRP